ncbi:putative siderophore transport system permease protein YfhA (plasmid) [Sodalis glossinidius str. 'morsitans']|nr:iron ABC transporter permease [Sodalis glossinidius]CAI59308.1 CbrC protein [Sodalis glossinidius]CAI59481.1 CbrC protein [Sodalis glossinidius]CRL46862.1 putative siderophore transport system permease protein YfhA [Sodalis glossinidius str. 'morsitans']
MANTVIWRYGRFLCRINVSTLWRVLLTGVLALMVAGFSAAQGAVAVSPLALLHVLSGSADPALSFIIGQLRLPRILLAALVGGALGVSGLILQSIIRNPLASPDLLGISSGASTAAVVYLSFFSMTLGGQYLPLAAMTGAAIAMLAVYGLAWQRGVSPLRLVLIGVGVSALLTAITTFLLVFSPLSTTLSAYVWMAGSVYGANWDDVRTLGLWLLALLPWLALLARQVMFQQLDDGLATGIGVRVQWLRGGLLLLSVALAGTAIAWGGAMAFVGLIAPHIARRLVAPTFSGQALMSTLTGAILVMLADSVGRVLFLPADLPAGIFVAVLGAPFFLYLLIRQRQ